jgi:glycosyltransferase involved in cell wall biosynthesis
MDLSIVIPAFEESKKISRDVEAASTFLESNHLAGEIIVVDDGSGDGTAEAAEKAKVSSGTTLKVVRLPRHTGKGYTVRTGIKQTSGEYVMFADSGCCVPYENALDGLKLLKSGACDIAHGSRKMPGSNIRKAQSWYRRVCARVFHWFVIYAMKIPAEITDTQCGFKIYKGEVGRRLYRECVTDDFMFDVEIIMRALKEGYRIKEFPIEWTCDRDSRLSPARSLWRIFSQLITIKRVLSKE